MIKKETNSEENDNVQCSYRNIEKKGNHMNKKIKLT